MENIVFIGSPVAGYFAEEVAREREYTYMQIDANAHIKRTTNDILAYAGYGKNPVSILIYDVDSYIDSAEEIASEIAGTARTLNAKPIIYMPSFLPGAALPQALLAKDIKNFIFYGSAADLKDQLQKNMGGYYDVNARKEVEEMEKVQAETQARIDNFRSIGFAGTQSRIGTTTQAIQCVKYLQLLGYTACYVQLNQTQYFDLSHRSGKVRAVSYVEKCAAWYDERKGPAVVYGGVDLYESQEALTEAQEIYDYYVYDYGAVFDRDFDRTAYIKDDVKILVGGGKVQEYDALERIIGLPPYASCSVILSFMPEGNDDRNDALRLLTAAGGNRPIVFTGYTPDPFVFSDVKMYEKLLPLEEKMIEELSDAKPQKKRFAFRKKVKA